ncbi:MAG: PPOX class F420-dependent oxidoreductase [Thermocrispum sp.]
MGERWKRFGARTARGVFRLMDRGRDRGVAQAARLPPTRGDFARFDGVRQCLLVSFRRSGEPMPSPINFGLSEGKLYIRTDGSTGKVKRLRNDPRAVLMPCGLRGKPAGEAVAATARFLPAHEEKRADDVIAANWSPGMRVLERGLDVGARAFGQTVVYVEFTPADG